MIFRAKVIPSGNATAVEIPDTVMRSLGPAGRPPVAIAINGHSWRTRVAVMQGRNLVGISAAHRAAAGIAEGDEVDVELELDEAPRIVEEPVDLREALDTEPNARAAFESLPFGLRQKHVNSIEDAKSDDVRQRRIRKLVETLSRA